MLRFDLKDLEGILLKSILYENIGGVFLVSSIFWIPLT